VLIQYGVGASRTTPHFSTLTIISFHSSPFLSQNLPEKQAAKKFVFHGKKIFQQAGVDEKIL